MRILVYGAGVLGCELAHVLMQNKKNVVTLLARGEWKEMIDQKGLVIRHWVQRKTTTERIKTVDTLAPDDYYDLVFVVVQAGQLPDVLPVLKANKSQYFVFVGNNPQAKQVLEFMQRPADKIAFGFQGTAGRREHDHVVSVYASAGMTVGGATTPLSGTFRTRLKTAFDGAKYKLTFYGDMDEWLKCHIAFVLPACYVCYACNGDLTRATKQQRHHHPGVPRIRRDKKGRQPAEMRIGYSVATGLGSGAQLGNGNGQRIQRQRRWRTVTVAPWHHDKPVFFYQKQRVIGHRIEFDGHNLPTVGQLVAHRAELLLHRVVNRHAAVFAFAPNVPLLLAGGEDMVFAWRPGRSTQRTQNIARCFFEGFRSHKGLRVNCKKEMPQMIRHFFTALADTGEHFQIVALL